MKKTNKIRNYSLMVLGVILLIAISCKKDKTTPDNSTPTDNLPVITTKSTTYISTYTATSGGYISADGGSPVTERGVCYSTTVNPPTVTETKVTNGTGTGSYSCNLTNLTMNTKYYVRAYAINNNGTAYGNLKIFTTSKLLATLTTDTVSNITKTTAKCGGNVLTDGGAAVTARGVCWDTDTMPTLDSSAFTLDSLGIGVFTSSLTNLIPNTHYYVRAYATTSSGTGYGNKVSFTTVGEVPVLTTAIATNITQTTATTGGTITTNYNSPITARGVCWSTSQNPTIADNKTTDGTGNGTFTSNLTGLTVNTTYYVRAYATNSFGTGYGNEISLITVFQVPVLTTTAVTNILQTTASSGGTITDNFGSPVTAKGVCWSSSQHPTINDNKTIDGSGSSTYTSSLTGLAGTTTYYIRAYATNGNGTGYGNELTFTTISMAPVLTTNAIGSITDNTATSGGNITNNYGSNVTARGVCWSTSQNPTITDNKSTDGTGSGGFLSDITGLTGSTTYYVRAYATNSYGTGYGNEINFTTNPPFQCGTTITDADGNVYNTVSIGSQCWMKENLNVGTRINASVQQANNSVIEKYCFNNDGANCAIYGGMYQWGEIVNYYNGATNFTSFNPAPSGNLQGICPLGWHIPKNSEWNALFVQFEPSFNYVNNPTSNIVGGKLKETGTSHWSNNTGADNASGFTALGGGQSNDLGSFFSLKSEAYFVSVSEYGFTACYTIRLENNSAKGYVTSIIKSDGQSVRCIK